MSDEQTDYAVWSDQDGRVWVLMDGEQFHLSPTEARGLAYSLERSADAAEIDTDNG